MNRLGPDPPAILAGAAAVLAHGQHVHGPRLHLGRQRVRCRTTSRGLDDQMMGYVFGIFAIGYALFQIPAGWFSDRAGPRRALTIVVVIWSIFTAMTGAVFTAISLLVVRFLFGVGEAGAYPGATRALYSWLPAKERGFGPGIFHSGARVGAAAVTGLDATRSSTGSVGG